jgi:hypothetical protein
MRFELEGIQYELKGLKSGPSQVIHTHRMEEILKRVAREWWLNFILWKLSRKMKIFQSN